MAITGLCVVVAACLLASCMRCSSPRVELGLECDTDAEISLLQSWTKVTLFSVPKNDPSLARVNSSAASPAPRQGGHPSTARRPSKSPPYIPAAAGDVRLGALISNVKDEGHIAAAPKVNGTAHTKSRQTEEGPRHLVSDLIRGWSGDAPENASDRDASEDVLGDLRHLGDRDASEATGVRKNSENDLASVLNALAIYGSLLVFAMILFQYLKNWYPLVYCYNDLTSVGEEYTEEDKRMKIANEIRSTSLPLLKDSNRGWVFGSWQFWWRLEDDELVEFIGLDMVMLLRFLQFSMSLLAWIGIPLIVVMCPINIYVGPRFSVGYSDLLARSGLNNLPDGSSWLWAHAVGVWYVVFVVHQLLNKYQARFVQLRVRWLRSMPEPRATTVMLQNIPDLITRDSNLAAEDALKQLISDVFKYVTNNSTDKIVKRVEFVRPASHLRWLTSQLDTAQTELEDFKSEHSIRKQSIAQFPDDTDEGQDSSSDNTKRKAGWVRSLSEKVDAAQVQVEDLGKQINIEKERVRSRVHNSTAFVTFTERKYAELFLSMRFKSSDYEFIQSTPPDPQDVDWDIAVQEQTLFGIQHAHHVSRFGIESFTREYSLGDVGPFLRTILGYALILLLFVFFVPIITTISTLTKLDYVRHALPVVETVIKHAPIVASMWDSLFASVGLTFFMGLLPSILMVIQRNFFPAVADREAQLGMERWYFFFQLIFVVLVTAVTGSITSVFAEIVDSPYTLVTKLADTLPSSSHFYLNWFVLQWFTAVLGLLRYMTLIKYRSILAGLNASEYFSVVMTEEKKNRRAKELSEPENPDSYGIGARSAETVLFLAVALVYCNLVPIICLFAFITFAVVRVIYGYLLIYAESRKPDLGGVFWCEQLQQVHTVMFIYTVFMFGVFSVRSNYGTVSFFVLATVPYNFYRYYLFTHSYRDDVLPLLDAKNHVVDLSNYRTKAPLPEDSYVQPELREPLAERTEAKADSGAPADPTLPIGPSSSASLSLLVHAAGQPSPMHPTSCLSGCLPPAPDRPSRAVRFAETVEPLSNADAQADQDSQQSSALEESSAHGRQCEWKGWEEAEPGLAWPL